MTYQVRPATFDDHAAVQHLMADAGWPVRSPAGWDWLFHQNPALAGRTPAPEMGWVIADGKTGDTNSPLYGYIANLPADYSLGARDIKAVTCSAYYVRPEAREASIKLMSAFFRQKGAELLLSTTANDMSAPLYNMFKASSPTEQSYRETLCFILDDAAVLRETATRRVKLPAVIATGAEFLAPLSFAARFLSGYASRPRDDFNGLIEYLGTDDIGAEFDGFWDAMRARNKLCARRDAQSLKWRMSDPDLATPMRLLAAYDGSGLAGYALCALHHPNADALPRMKLIDIATRPDLRDVHASLLSRTIDEARASGAALLEVPHGGSRLADTLKPHHPIRLRSPHASHYTRTRDAELNAALGEAGGWYATGIDGDISLCVRNGTTA